MHPVPILWEATIAPIATGVVQAFGRLRRPVWTQNGDNNAKISTVVSETGAIAANMLPGLSTLPSRRLSGLENVTRTSLDIVVSRKLVKYLSELPHLSVSRTHH